MDGRVSSIPTQGMEAPSLLAAGKSGLRPAAAHQALSKFGIQGAGFGHAPITYTQTTTKTVARLSPFNDEMLLSKMKSSAAEQYHRTHQVEHDNHVLKDQNQHLQKQNGTLIEQVQALDSERAQHAHAQQMFEKQFADLREIGACVEDKHTAILTGTKSIEQDYQRAVAARAALQAKLDAQLAEWQALRADCEQAARAAGEAAARNEGLTRELADAQAARDRAVAEQAAKVLVACAASVSASLS